MDSRHSYTLYITTNLQNHARLCKNLACKTCLARARDMSLFLHFLAQSCTNSCKILQKKCKKLQLVLQHLAKFLARYVQDCARIMQDCARIVQEKGHIACTCQASLACKILAQSCMILQVRFCWVECWIYEDSALASRLLAGFLPFQLSHTVQLHECSIFAC